MDMQRTVERDLVDQPDGRSTVDTGLVPDPVDAVLRAFQMLQMKNAHASAAVASSIGIGATDMRALLFIASADGVTPKQTGDFMELSSGAITSLIDRMVAAGFVQRTPNPNDRRSLMLNLAPAGTAAVESVVDTYRRAFRDSVPAEHLALVAAVFDAIGDSLTRTAASNPGSTR
jgi:DNA-binding MarR family transcriptional regulator